MHKFSYLQDCCHHSMYSYVLVPLSSYMSQNPWAHFLLWHIVGYFQRGDFGKSKPCLSVAVWVECAAQYVYTEWRVLQRSVQSKGLFRYLLMIMDYSAKLSRDHIFWPDSVEIYVTFSCSSLWSYWMSLNADWVVSQEATDLWKAVICFSSMR